MKSKKGLKYYAIIFIFSVIALGLYTTYLYFKDGELDPDIILPLLYVPIMFTGFLFTFDKLFDKIFPGKVKVSNNKFNAYLKAVSEGIQVECEFSIEEYKNLRSNQKFQKGLGQAFRVYDNGENQEINFEFLERKFKKGSNEYMAFQVVIKEVKKMMENS